MAASDGFVKSKINPRATGQFGGSIVTCFPDGTHEVENVKIMAKPRKPYKVTI